MREEWCSLDDDGDGGMRRKEKYLADVNLSEGSSIRSNLNCCGCLKPIKIGYYNLEMTVSYITESRINYRHTCSGCRKQVKRGKSSHTFKVMVKKQFFDISRGKNVMSGQPEEFSYEFKICRKCKAKILRYYRTVMTRCESKEDGFSFVLKAPMCGWCAGEVFRFYVKAETGKSHSSGLRTPRLRKRGKWGRRYEKRR